MAARRTGTSEELRGAVSGRRGRALRRAPGARAVGPGVLAVALLLGVAGCATPGLGPGAVLIRDEPPSVEPPTPEVRSVAAVDHHALPSEARAQFPALDGDAFLVIWPAKPAGDQSARHVLDSIIEPVLKAIGFRHGTAALAPPPEPGIPQPTADARRLATALAREYGRRSPPPGETTRRALASLGGHPPHDDDLDQRLKALEGGTVADLVAALERKQLHYPFRQMVDDIPVDNAVVIASRFTGETVTSVTGALLDGYTIANARVLDAARAVAAARPALRDLGLDLAPGEASRPAAEPVLLPYGTDANGVTRLRHAHRVRLSLVFQGRPAPALVWIDAQTGAVLKLEPYLRSAAATGRTWDRDPGLGTVATGFDVDVAAGGQFVLRLAGVATRVDYQGDGLSDVFNAADVAVAAAGTALFDQAPINDGALALCGTGGNKGFQQVNVFATLHWHRDTLLATGMYTPYPDPRFVWAPRVESVTIGCGAWSDMNFGACEGYKNAACPEYVDPTGATSLANLMNFAHDNSMVAHELGHSVTWRLTTGRPSDWCGAASCPVPLALGQFHDIADFWAAHLESTNCVGGWVAKNVGGVDASLYCRSHQVTGLPRLHQARVPFDPTRPMADADDHFPEHRAISKADYADGQIAAAALWQVRLGMQSRAAAGGVPLFGAWVVQALREAGFFGFTPGASDRGTYQRLHDLGARLMTRWASGGLWAHTANKLQAGLARAGLFLIPWDCLDGKAQTAANCGTKDNGGDAVIDVDDRDLSDDAHGVGVQYPESDFLRLGGPAPLFHVWTGPRYRLSGQNGASTIRNPAPCNAKFQVEVSVDPAFPPASTIQSGFILVDTNPGTPASPECYGTWQPNTAQWDTLKAGGAGARVHYRARTRNTTNGNERLSTQPGNGTWTVPPPYAVITDTGLPEP